MPDITPLLCTTCGSQLKPTAEQDRFVCSKCGTEYLVERNRIQSQPIAGTPPQGKRDTASVLLELLEYVPDAKKLDTLLNPANLLKLLLLYGWKEQDLKQQLAAGKIPGELLLELLKREPNPDVLLSRLGRSPNR
jgi:predicted RNA-binding Zn-ribbon protein involved in translation (DUF1610 family)